jgi:C-terminal processing protease CtpA/Prc
LTVEVRVRIGIRSNKGIRIQQVVNDTPAFEADILVGDIVLGVNGRGVSAGEPFQQRLQNTAGQRLELAIIRNGESLTKIVQLP